MMEDATGTLAGERWDFEGDFLFLSCWEQSRWAAVLGPFLLLFSVGFVEVVAGCF